MKPSKLILIATIFLIALTASLSRLHAADTEVQTLQRYEYATIRWDGRDNTHIIRPNGEVEHLGAKLTKIQKPSRTDDRSFYMNIVMNSLAKEGYEFVGISNDDIVMKRAVTPAK
jgi:hypothetical protein